MNSLVELGTKTQAFLTCYFFLAESPNCTAGATKEIDDLYTQTKICELHLHRASTQNTIQSSYGQTHPLFQEAPYGNAIKLKTHLIKPFLTYFTLAVCMKTSTCYHKSTIAKTCDQFSPDTLGR